MQILPGNYKFLVSEPIGNYERFAFIYDKRTVINTGLVSNIVLLNPENKKERYFLSRLPYCASFKACRFDFTIITVHIYYGNDKDNDLREAEIQNLVDHIDKLSQDETKTFDRDIFLVGDFNIEKNKDKFYNALVKKNFKMPKQLNDIKTNYSQNKTFDKIAWVNRESFDFNNNCNIVPYGNILYQELEENERKK
jgi:exonuclease III